MKLTSVFALISAVYAAPIAEAEAEAAPFRCSSGRCFGNGWSIFKREDGTEIEVYESEDAIEKRQALPFRCSSGRCFGNGWSIFKRDTTDGDADLSKREAFRCPSGRCFGNGWSIFKREEDGAEVEAYDPESDPDFNLDFDESELADLPFKREAAPFRCPSGRCFGNGWSIFKREDGAEVDVYQAELPEGTSELSKREAFRCPSGRCFGNGWSIFKREEDGAELEVYEDEESSVNKREALPFRCPSGRCFGNGWSIFKRDTETTA